MGDLQLPESKRRPPTVTVHCNSQDTYMNYEQEFEKNPYEKVVRIREKNLKLLKECRGKKSVAAFLDEIISEYFQPNLFKKKK